MYDYDEYNEDYEPTQEEIEEGEGMEATNTEITAEKLKIEFDTENFANGIVCAVVSEVKKKLYSEIVSEIKKEVLEGMKETIMLNAHEIVKSIITDYMQSEKIQIGGNGFFDDEPIKEFTMQEYAKKCIADSIKKGKFRIFTGWDNDRYSSRGVKAQTKEIGYEEYIRSELAIGNDVKKYLDEQIMDIKNSVNKGVKEMFDTSTKQMLSESVLKVLMANETYQKIQSNIACIADKATE